MTAITEWQMICYASVSDMNELSYNNITYEYIQREIPRVPNSCRFHNDVSVHVAKTLVCCIFQLFWSHTLNSTYRLLWNARGEGHVIRLVNVYMFQAHAHVYLLMCEKVEQASHTQVT